MSLFFFYFCKNIILPKTHHWTDYKKIKIVWIFSVKSHWMWCDQNVMFISYIFVSKTLFKPNLLHHWLRLVKIVCQTVNIIKSPSLERKIIFIGHLLWKQTKKTSKAFIYCKHWIKNWKKNNQQSVSLGMTMSFFLCSLMKTRFHYWFLWLHLTNVKPIIPCNKWISDGITKWNMRICEYANMHTVLLKVMALEGILQSATSHQTHKLNWYIVCIQINKTNKQNASNHHVHWLKIEMMMLLLLLLLLGIWIGHLLVSVTALTNEMN